jgi:hypothetical protein
LTLPVSGRSQPAISAGCLGELSGGFSFRPVGSQLATASQSGVDVWDLQTPRVIDKLTGLATSNVSFSDGIHLAATTVDGRSTVYALSVDELLRLARSLVTRELLTDQESRQYLYVDRCSAA